MDGAHSNLAALAKIEEEIDAVGDAIAATSAQLNTLYGEMNAEYDAANQKVRDGYKGQLEKLDADLSDLYGNRCALEDLREALASRLSAAEIMQLAESYAA